MDKKIMITIISVATIIILTLISICAFLLITRPLFLYDYYPGGEIEKIELSYWVHPDAKPALLNDEQIKKIEDGIFGTTMIWKGKPSKFLGGPKWINITFVNKEEKFSFGVEGDEIVLGDVAYKSNGYLLNKVVEILEVITVKLPNLENN